MTSLVKKRDFPQKKKRLFHTQINGSAFKLGFCTFSLNSVFSFVSLQRFWQQKAPGNDCLDPEKGKKQLLCFLFGWCFLLCLEACGAPGEGKKRNFIFSWEKSRLYRLPSKCKNSDTSLLRKSATKTEPAEYSTSSIEGSFLKQNLGANFVWSRDLGSKHFQIRSDVFALEVFHSGYRYLCKHSVGIQTPEESFVSCNSTNYSL